MPSHELFLKQPAEYQASVLPEGVRRIIIEAAHPMSWHRFMRAGDVMIGIDKFGASAPYQRLYTEYGITVDAVVAQVE
jgi:transketolase